MVQSFGHEMSVARLHLNNETDAERLSVDIGGGKLVAFSARAPDKDTDNEDSVAAFAFTPDTAVLAIADGAGGLPAGRRASQAAIAALERSLSDSKSSSLLRTAVLNGIDAANDAVLALSNGAATTLTIVTIEGKTARCYQIGDSEALIVGQRGRVRSQTLAHSPTGFAVEAGMLTERAALHHAERHLLSNFIGANDMRIDIGPEVTLNPRDTVLLASDGLTDNVHVHEIIGSIRKGPLDEALGAITGLAGHRMKSQASSQPSKPDDLSVILFRKPY